LSIWLACIVVVGGVSHSAGAKYANNFTLPATDSSRAYSILQANFPSQAGDSDQIVVHAKVGTLYTPSNEAAVQAMLKQVSQLSVVRSVMPFYQTGLVSADKTIGLTTIGLNAQFQNENVQAVKKLISTAQSVDSSALQVELGGQSIEGAGQSRQQTSELLGVVFSLIILFFAFRRSFYCAVLPLISALSAIALGTSIIGVLTHVFSVPEFGPILATLVSLGVGVDYALFIVSRHRNGLLAGRTVEDAAVQALDTSGRAVLFAGVTVCIALLGMFALQVSFLYGVALSAALVVALTMLASITLLPAMLGFFGLKALRRAERRAIEGEPIPEEPQGFWLRWSRFIEGRHNVTGLVALGLIVVIALPFFSMRQGLADAGNDSPSSTTRQAYDLLAKAFGPGYNGPLQLVAAVQDPADSARFAAFTRSLEGRPGVARVGATVTSPNGRAEVALVYPSSSPDSAQTSTLLHRVRSEVRGAEAGSSLVIHVGGPTASGEDFSHILSAKMPQFVAVVVILASLLLMAVFRSVLVPLLASIMNLLSIGAALGVLTAAFQYGWGKSLLGFSEAGPIQAFLPVMLFAILFGLSMDYEVFLVSRIHEEWVQCRDNSTAVVRGQAETGRVITAAAMIMILVFLSFVFGGQLVIKEFGVGFAGAVFIDAFVIRTVLVPSAMHIIGKANWWLPRWLDRSLPVLHVEPVETAPALTGAAASR
jgi:RND superfamily putative drug exporter